jgi:cytochrome P450
MREQESLIQMYVDTLIDRVRDRADQTIDLGQWYNFTTFDIIGDLVFGESFHCLESGQYNPWIAHIFASGRLGTVMQALAFVPILKGFLLRIMAPRSAREAHEAHTKATRAKMSRRLQAEQDRPDLIEGLISRRDELVGYTQLLPRLPH